MADIQYKWVPVDLGDGKLLVLSRDTTLASIAPRGSIRALPATSAIYRWGFFKGSVLREAYVGETENLKQRIQGYLRPGPTQATNKRMNALFWKAVDEGFEVRLEILEIEPVMINQVRVRNQNFADPFLRKMIENFVLADFDVVNCKLHNVALNRIERRRRKALKDNPYLEGLRSLGVNVD